MRARTAIGPALVGQQNGVAPSDRAEDVAERRWPCHRRRQNVRGGLTAVERDLGAELETGPLSHSSRQVSTRLWPQWLHGGVIVTD